MPRWTIRGQTEIPARRLQGGGIVCPKVYGKDSVIATLTGYGVSADVRLVPTESPAPHVEPENLLLQVEGAKIALRARWIGSPALPVRCEARLVKGGPVFLGITRRSPDPSKGSLDQHIPLSKEQDVGTIWADLSPGNNDQIVIESPAVQTQMGRFRGLRR